MLDERENTGRTSEWKRAKDTEGVLIQTHIGGQALLEGIMMRGRYNYAIAVRRPDGSIYTEEHDLVSGKDRNSWMYWPIIRGCTALVESLTLGYQSLEVAAENAYLDDEDDESAGAWEDAEDDHELNPGSDEPDSHGSLASTLEQSDAPDSPVAPVQSDAPDHSTTPAQPARQNDSRKSDDDSIPKSVLTLGMILGVLLGMGIFIALPAFLTNLIVGEYGKKTLAWNLVDGALRIVIFIVYIFLISRMSDIRRMFGYHGAEHRTIHCFEHGMELTPENANLFPSLHVRCGTAFMLMTMIVAIIVFTIVPIPALIGALGIKNNILRFMLLIGCRILLVPLIAGLSYEVTVKWAGSHPDNPFVQLVLWPGMQMQRLTTNKPDYGQLQCAIAAMQLVLNREEREKQREQQVQ